MKNSPGKILPLIFCISCATVDVEREVRQAKAGPVAGEPGRGAVIAVPIETEAPPPEVIEVERPVYVPERPVSAVPPSRGRAAVEAANGKGILRPEEYSHAAMIYDYDGDFVYEVYTQPLRASDIRLENGERSVEAPFISDSERWMLGAGVSYEHGVPVQHIYVKPVESGLEASLIINTDRRVYHIILRSYRDVHMPMVRWRYPRSGMPENYIGPPSGGGVPADGPGGGPGEEAGIAGIDPRFISFNYRITYGLFSRPAWIPRLVYDDGNKTYINFPENVLRRDLPAVFENRNDVVNYRVAGNIIIIDRLIEQLVVKIGKAEIVIEKKKG
jgi:type IV secretion system protein VirB9